MNTMSEKVNHVLSPCTLNELTSLKMSEDCGLADYVIKAETATTSQKSAGEEISDSLLVAMALNGLPTQYNKFKTVVTQGA